MNRPAINGHELVQVGNLRVLLVDDIAVLRDLILAGGDASSVTPKQRAFIRRRPIFDRTY